MFHQTASWHRLKFIGTVPTFLPLIQGQCHCHLEQSQIICKRQSVCGSKDRSGNGDAVYSANKTASQWMYMLSFQNPRSEREELSLAIFASYRSSRKPALIWKVRWKNKKLWGKWKNNITSSWVSEIPSRYMARIRAINKNNSKA